MRRFRKGENRYGVNISSETAAARPPAGQEDHTSKEQERRAFHRKRLAGAPDNVDLLLDQRQRTRERLLQIELYAGANAAYEEKAGEYEVADLHRRYASYVKAVRLNQPLPKSLQKGSEE